MPSTPALIPLRNGTLISSEGLLSSHTPCNLDICDVKYSLLAYQPSIPANAFFAGAFGLLALVHLFLGIRWKAWGFMGGMLLGCIGEVIGYVGRVAMHDNPFLFKALVTQVVCLTVAPVFFTASIYVCLSKTIHFFGAEVSRFKPELFIWIFLPFDIVCLILQAAGGALSVIRGGPLGVDMSMAGLILQVIVLAAFCGCFADYLIRYKRSPNGSQLNGRPMIFFGGLAFSILFVFVRCAYRVAELKDGYRGEMIKHEKPFIVLEGVMMVLAALSLCFGNPGLIFSKNYRPAVASSSSSQNQKGYDLSEVSDSA